MVPSSNFGLDGRGEFSRKGKSAAYRSLKQPRNSITEPLCQAPGAIAFRTFHRLLYGYLCTAEEFPNRMPEPLLEAIDEILGRPDAPVDPAPGAAHMVQALVVLVHEGVAESVVPRAFAPGRARLRVTTHESPTRLAARLLESAPPELGLRRVRVEQGTVIVDLAR